ncbi:trypsin-like peptidase domain-containing protein [Candidatus Shapirobacteria bacterium]|nr:trypsin-like peptidase domain-containing protein [Candidatus Shapirobacteria bacterium]
MRPKNFLINFAIVLLAVGLVLGGALLDRQFHFGFLDRFTAATSLPSNSPAVVEQKVVKEESVVIEVAEKASPSVVTVGMKKKQTVGLPSDLFSFFGFTFPNSEREIQQDVGTGFVIDSQGLIVTNKHVVADTKAEYEVITADNKKYPVKNIYRDPANDLAFLKIEAQGLAPVELGDSDSLKVGQFVVAIGTALGEFRHTVTTGVISGLGRGITAGSVFEGYIEELDNVIQTDAAINPGNSGGPLINSAGQVIGVNVAVASGAENIGFALPINTVKEALATFRQTGEFSRPFLGVNYMMVSQEAAILNEIPEGAYVAEVVAGSPADEAGIKPGDIIISIDGQKIKDTKGGLVEIINKKKVGDKIKIMRWRKGESQEIEVILQERTG